MDLSTIDDWLRHQASLHPRAMDLTLDRCRAVARRAGLAVPAAPVVTVVGTNGKGACVRRLEAALGAGGLRVGCYMSPWLQGMRESVRVGGEAVGETSILDAFARVEAARGEAGLTAFEFQTLAALAVFEAARCEAIVLEAGLGGAGDAVNVVDADAVIVTSIGVDHRDWLGHTRSAVAHDKAGVARPGQPFIVADPSPPWTLLAEARRRGAVPVRAGRDYRWPMQGRAWCFETRTARIDALPLPPAPRDLPTVAAVAAALTWSVDFAPLDAHTCITAAASESSPPGRLEIHGGDVVRVLDVAHNPAAVRRLRLALRSAPVPGRTRAVFGARRDKDCVELARVMRSEVDEWRLVSLPGPRGQSAAALERRVRAIVPAARLRPGGNLERAWRDTLECSRPGDRAVAFGSFDVIGPLRALESATRQPDT